MGWVDGQYAASLGDVRVVSSVGANTLWGTTFDAAADMRTVAEVMRAAGISWTVRGGISNASGNNRFGAFAGLQRGIEGAGNAPIWEGAQIIRDVYGAHATKGQVGLTLNVFWNFGLSRADNFKRLKFVS